MSYSISTDPGQINEGETATATVDLPEQEDVIHEVEVVRRGTDEIVASASVTVHAEQLTVGTESDASTDYFVRAPGLEVVQVGEKQFELRA